MIFEVLPSDLRALVKKVLSLFDLDGDSFRKSIIFKMRDSSLAIRRSLDYFKYEKTLEEIEFMDLHACKRTIDKIFMYMDLYEAERQSVEDNRYLYRLSDVSSFREAMQKELAISLHANLYKIFHYLYSNGHLEVSYLDTHIEMFFDLGSMTEEEGKLCMIFIIVETSRY